MVNPQVSFFFPNFLSPALLFCVPFHHPHPPLLDLSSHPNHCLHPCHLQCPTVTCRPATTNHPVPISVSSHCLATGQHLAAICCLCTIKDTRNHSPLMSSPSFPLPFSPFSPTGLWLDLFHRFVKGFRQRSAISSGQLGFDGGG